MHCIVMENMEGGDLQQYIESKKFTAIPVDMARSIIKQIAEALKYLHNRRIIHRDIKLENIMLSSHETDCSAKLADFGLAEIVNVNGDII